MLALIIENIGDNSLSWLSVQGTKSIQHFFSTTGPGTAEAALSPKKQISNSRETISEKSKRKQKGIMKYLQNVSSIQDDDHHQGTAAQSKDIPDGPPNLEYTEDADRPSKEGQPERNHSVDPIEGLDEMAQPTTGEANSEDRVGSNLRISNCKWTSTDSLRHSADVLQPQDRGDDKYSTPDGTDLGPVDLKEQMRILADIQRSSAQAPISAKQNRKPSAKNPVKRPRQSASGAGQQSIGKFFRAQGKPP